MSDEKPDGPQYIKTKQIPRVEVPGNTLDAVLSELRAMRSETSDRFDTLNATVDTLVEDGKSANKRITTIEVRFDEFVDRAAKNSMRAKQSSEIDLKHDAAIAMLHTKVDRVEEKTDAQTAMLKKAADVAKDPKVIAFAMLVYGIVRLWAAKHGLELP
jgi:hypothetical protein